jgi:hypothetical protein
VKARLLVFAVLAIALNFALLWLFAWLRGDISWALSFGGGVAVCILLGFCMRVLTPGNSIGTNLPAFSICLAAPLVNGVAIVSLINVVCMLNAGRCP